MKSLLMFLVLSVNAHAANLKVDVTGPIDRGIRSQILSLKLKVDKEPQVIKVYIDTPGGRADVMMEMYGVMQELKALGHSFECHIIRAYSAGFFLASACNVRYAKKTASFMWHNAQFMYRGRMGILVAEKIIKEMSESQNGYDAIVKESFNPGDEIFEYVKNKEVFMDSELMNLLSPGYIVIKED